MNDYLISFEQHKDIKEIADLIDEVKKLRMYYNTQQYESMLKHIDSITRKHFIETQLWNATNTIKPTTVQQSYINAEAFLRLNGFPPVFRWNRDSVKFCKLTVMFPKEGTSPSRPS